MAVAEAVAGRAIAEGIAGIEDGTNLAGLIETYVWEPVYHPYQRTHLHAGRMKENPDFAI
jgi:hypothetical protein